jgi:hypothetical protein
MTTTTQEQPHIPGQTTAAQKTDHNRRYINQKDLLQDNLESL